MADTWLAGAYLERIGLDGPVEPTSERLTELMVAHLAAVPFENLDIHLGIPIELDVDRIVAKLVDRRRGGFCYELNGAFAELLDRLGFPVVRMEARVHGPDGLGIAFDHLCLAVETDGPWLVDVGFGSAFAQPLRLDVGAADQHDPAGVFRIVEADEGWYDLIRDDTPQYRFSRRPRALADFAEGCLHHQTSPDSHFTRGTVCTLAVDGGRVTMAGSALIRTTADGGRTTTQLTTDQLGSVLADQFGVHLTPKQLAELAAPPD